MTLGPGWRKLALTAHVVCSVGWLGAVAVSLALSIAALTVQDAQTVRAAYLAMDVAAWSVLVPLALASLLTGLVQALGTPWGLLRHWWVLVKLALTVLATLVLLLYTQAIGYVAGLAAHPSSASVSDVRIPSPVLHAGAALLVLLVATALSVYKPRGRTRYGWRKQQDLRPAPQP